MNRVRVWEPRESVVTTAPSTDDGFPLEFREGLIRKARHLLHFASPAHPLFVARQSPSRAKCLVIGHRSFPYAHAINVLHCRAFVSAKAQTRSAEFCAQEGASDQVADEFMRRSNVLTGRREHDCGWVRPLSKAVQERGAVRLRSICPVPDQLVFACARPPTPVEPASKNPFSVHSRTS